MTQAIRTDTGSGGRYVLVTAAYNEESFIQGTIESVIAQTIRPLAWVIVSDGSTDGTDAIVSSYAARFPFISLLRRERAPGRSFGSKVRAVTAGFDRVRELDYEFIGNLDADLTFEGTYFEELLDKFRRDPRLGVAGGWIHEDGGCGFRARDFNLPESVPHAVQLLRRACYQAVGDYLPLPYGGEDTCAVVTARMYGWRAETFRDLPVRHHRRTASAGWVLRNRMRQGLTDYSLGYHPLFELLKCVRRTRERPYVVGSLVWFGGFLYGCVRRERRIVSHAFVRFLRQDQRRRMWVWASGTRIHRPEQGPSTVS